MSKCEGESETLSQLIRYKLHDSIQKDREKDREALLVQRRGDCGEVGESLKAVTPAEVKTLAKHLKSKGQVNLKLLTKLKVALYQDPENVKTFLHVDGSLQSVIRILSGQNAVLQLEAASCICNLAVVDVSTVQITKSSSPYLISGLESINSEFTVMCAWALGNLAGSNIESWKVLHSQEVIPKLLHLLLSQCTEVVHSAVYALLHYVRIGLANLQCSDVEAIAKHVLPLMEKEGEACWIIFLLSCSAQYDSAFFNMKIEMNILQLLHQKVSDVESQYGAITALVRALANIVVNEVVAVAVLDNSCLLMEIVHVLLHCRYAYICNETSWLIANLLHHQSVRVQEKVAECRFYDQCEKISSTL